MIHPDIKIGSLVWLAPNKMSMQHLHLIPGESLADEFEKKGISLDNFDDDPESNDPVHILTVPLVKDCGFYPALVIGFDVDLGGDRNIRLSFGDRGTFTIGWSLLSLIEVLPWTEEETP